MTKDHERECHLALGIYIKQAVDAGVHEPAHHPRGQSEGRGNSEHVGEQRAVVPAEMAVGPRLILPGVAPVSAGANYGERRVSDGRFTARGFHQHAAIITGA